MPQNKCPEESELIAQSMNCVWSEKEREKNITQTEKHFAHCKNHLHMMYHVLEGYLIAAMGKHMLVF